MLFALGINHHNAPLAIRERVCFQAGQLPHALAELLDAPLVREAAILSTCNRTELYCHTASSEYLAQWLADYHHLDLHQLQPYLYTLPQDQAVYHAFRVACGLDSMVLGEPQILGQMKEAMRAAEAVGTLGTHLHKLFQRAFSVAKEVRSNTAIGCNIVSLAAACVHLAHRQSKPLSESSILFIGAGEMVELCAAHFAAHTPRRITIANRSAELGLRLAKNHGGSAIHLDQLPTFLPEHDIVVSCTASPCPIINPDMLTAALSLRQQRPMLMIDLAVPRDIAPEVGAIEGVQLYTIDDLSGIVAQGQESRQAAVGEAEAIIAARTSGFLHWLEGRRESVPLIRELRDRSERMRRQELERAMKALNRGESPETVINQLSQRLANKILHAPTTALHLAEGEAREKLHLAAIRLFHLNK